MPCGGPNQAPCGGPVPRVGATTPAPAACPSTTWTAGPWRYTQDAAGCLTRQPAGTPIPDGTYANPRITMQGGHVVAVEAGPAPVLVPPTLCGEQAAGTPGTSTILLGTDPCNLMTMTAGRYSARAYLEAAAGTPLTITGCGTAADPFRFSIALPGAPTGATFLGAGIQFTNGLMQQFVLPVMSVSADAATGLTVTTNTTTGAVFLTRTPTAAARLPGVVCNSSTNPTNGVLVGTPNTSYVLRLPNTATNAYTPTTDAAGAATIANMATGVYEVYVGTTSLGYISYERCTYVAPTP